VSRNSTLFYLHILISLGDLQQAHYTPPPEFSALDLISPRGDSLKQDGGRSAEEDAPHWPEQQQKHGYGAIGKFEITKIILFIVS
jgi:hypothetical protein